MSVGIVHAVSPSQMLCDLNIGNDVILEDVTIPTNLTNVTSGCRVVYSKEDNTLLVITSYPHLIKQDPLDSPKQKTSVSPYFIPSESMVEGDYILNVPEAGYIGLLKGFVSFLGSSPLANIMTFGTKKLVKIIAQNLEWSGGKFIDFKINSDREGPPIIDIKLGNLYIASDTSDYLKIGLKDIFETIMDENGVNVTTINKNEKGMDTRTEYKYDKESKQYKIFTRIKDPIQYNIGNITASLDDTIIHTKTLKLDGASKYEKWDGRAQQEYGSLKEVIHGKKTTEAENVVVKVGGKSGPGKYRLQVGTLSGLELDSITNITKLDSPAGVELLGSGDFLVSGTMLTSLLQQILFACLTLCTAAPMGPSGAGLASQAAGMFSAALSQLPNILLPRHRVMK